MGVIFREEAKLIWTAADDHSPLAFKALGEGGLPPPLLPKDYVLL